jgi:AraC-like DNA-binding protein
MPAKAPPRKAEPIISIIENQMISWWERRGLDHLAVTEPTLSAFKQQGLPETMSTSVKRRVGRKASLRGNRNFNNANSYRELWLEDGQAIYNYPALIFVLDGQADFHIADYVAHCPQNHFLLFRDNVPRQTAAKSHLEGNEILQRYCSVLWFFTPPGTNSLIAYICRSQGTRHWSEGHHIVSHAEVVHSFQLFMREMHEKSPGYRQIASSSFQSFLHLLLRELKEERSVKGETEFAKISAARDLSPIEQAREYIKNHLNQPLTASRVAHVVYMSRNNFMQHFTRETGQTFHDYVTEKRMQAARRLLSTGHWSIEYVARFTGLKPSQFRNQFKIRFGITPSEFRRQSQIKGRNQ